MVRCTPPLLNHISSLSIIDELPSSPILESLGEQLGIKTIFAAETATFVFATLPIMLYYRYTTAVIGNERSANVGNLVWAETGEEVNHQWGKTKESEVIMHSYIRKALVRNYCSYVLASHHQRYVIIKIIDN